MTYLAHLKNGVKKHHKNKVYFVHTTRRFLRIKSIYRSMAYLRGAVTIGIVHDAVWLEQERNTAGLLVVFACYHKTAKSILSLRPA